MPDAITMVKNAGLSGIADHHYDPISYTWHLKRQLAEYAEDPFDFIFIDGAHNWDTDGFAFLLCDRILKTGGWTLFDDLDWSYGSSKALRGTDIIKGMTDEQLKATQVRDIWETLVLTHPSYGNFSDDGDWGWAQKISSDTPRTLEIRRQVQPSFLERMVSRVFK